MDTAIGISGRIHYPNLVSATIVENGGAESLLILDRPPLGHFGTEDIAAAASLYRDFLNKAEGAPISLLGVRGFLQGRSIVLIVRANPAVVA